MNWTVGVTGSAGFIGRWVVRELRQRGHEVVGLDNFSRGRHRNIAAFEDDPGVSITSGDVCDSGDVAAMFDVELDACIHLAAEIDVHESLEDPDAHFEANMVGTRNVLRACHREGVRLALVGTCMVYDVADSESGIDEHHSLKPASPYAGTKLAAENLAESYCHGYDLPVTILRPFNTYGPYQEGGVVPIFVDRDLRGETLQIYGDGTQTRDLLYATDCARFVVDATVSDRAIGEVFNAGTGSDVSINDLAELIATESVAIKHVEHPHPQSEVDTLRSDPSKAKELLDWEPTVSLAAGIEKVRQWLSADSDR